jgi:hypothetical protein
MTGLRDIILLLSTVRLALSSPAGLLKPALVLAAHSGTYQTNAFKARARTRLS